MKLKAKIAKRETLFFIESSLRHDYGAPQAGEALDISLS